MTYQKDKTITEYESMTPSFWIGWGIPLIVYEIYCFGLNKIEADSSKVERK